MAKSTAVKSKGKAAVKPGRKRKSSPISDADAAKDRTAPEAVLLDKAFVLRLVIAKLEASKSCDWHELAQKLSGGRKGDDSATTKGAKRGKAPTAEREEKGVGSEWTGTELHDMYHNTILPALKAGRALWIDSPADPTRSPFSLSEGSSEAAVTPLDADIFFEADEGMGNLDSPKIPSLVKGRKAAQKPDSAPDNACRQRHGSHGDDNENVSIDNGSLFEVEVKPKARKNGTKLPADTAKNPKSKKSGQTNSYRRSVLGKKGVSGNGKSTRPAYNARESVVSKSTLCANDKLPASRTDGEEDELGSEEGEGDAMDAVLA